MMTKIRLSLPYLFLLLLTALVLDLANPLFDKPARDGGFFLYTGAQILDGKIPYQDFWDSKGPAIFYINALGLWLGGGSRWGVWFVEFLCIFGALLLLYRALLKHWGLGAAFFGASLAGLGLRVVLGYGNYTEEYALLFNAVGLVIFFSAADTERAYGKYFWVGALFGLSFTFRANNIGGLFAILIAVFLFYVFKRNYVEALRSILTMLAGFTFPLLLWTIYFSLLGSAGEMIYASILFNFSYAAAQDRGWLSLLSGFGRYGMGWYGWFALFAWGLLALRALVRFRQGKLPIFETFLLFWFPIEILLSNLSGRDFAHYYINWTLAVAVYSAFAFADLRQMTSQSPQLNLSIGVLAALVVTAALFIIFPSSWGRYAQTLRSSEKEYSDPLSAYTRANTQPNDLVLTWYPEMGVNFMAGRTSPVKYLYYPLFLDGSLTEEIESSYMADLNTHRPTLILDCSRSADAVPSLDRDTRREQYAQPGARSKMYIQPGMGEIFDFVKVNYSIETAVDGCIIFRLNAP